MTVGALADERQRRGYSARPAPAQKIPRSRRASASGAPAGPAPTALTAATLVASSAPRFAGMNADAKLATREKVSMVIAPVSEIGTSIARRISQASADMHRYAAIVAATSTVRRV